LEYTALDGEYFSAPAWVNITIISVNDPPLVTDLEFQDVGEGFIFNITPLDIDGDDVIIQFIPHTNEGWGQSFFGAVIEPQTDGSYIYHTGIIPTMTDFIFYGSSGN